VREILIDQHSKRSHPNKAVDVVVCTTSWIDSGSRFINSGPAFETNRLESCSRLRCVFPFPWPARLPRLRAPTSPQAGQLVGIDPIILPLAPLRSFH
jgi:hypothetical protein